jgi:hypothetical protein
LDKTGGTHCPGHKQYCETFIVLGTILTSTVWWIPNKIYVSEIIFWDYWLQYSPYHSVTTFLILISHCVKILPVVLYGYETWYLTLKEEHRLRVFKNRVLRKIFWPKKDEVMGEWRKLHNGELHNLYSSPDVIRQIKSRRTRWAGHVASKEDGRNM